MKICVYNHHNIDATCGAAIYRYATGSCPIKMVEPYDLKLGSDLDVIAIGLPGDTVKAIAKIAKSVVWIGGDANYKLSGVTIVADDDKGLGELMWEKYVGHDKEIPEPVRMLGVIGHHIWLKRGLESYDMDPADQDAMYIWTDLFNGHGMRLQQMIADGAAITRYLKRHGLERQAL